MGSVLKLVVPECFPFTFYKMTIESLSGIAYLGSPIRFGRFVWVIT